MYQEMNRRDFIKQTLLASATGALALGAASAPSQQAAPAAAPEVKSLPMGKIGPLNVSRLIMGGNMLIYGAHSRDLKYVGSLMRAYNTDAKILETLALAEQLGINTIAINNTASTLHLLEQHRRAGGKMQWLIYIDNGGIRQDVAIFAEEAKRMADMGASALMLQGGVADALVGHPDMLAKIVEIGKKQKLPMGMAAHSLDVVLACEKNGLPVDFYQKTFHHLNYPSAPRPDEIKGASAEVPAYWCKDSRATAEAMRKVEKPWIAFKILAAGAIPPKDAIPWAFQNGADHVLVGMLDFNMAEDVGITRDALAEVMKIQRDRPWRS